MLDSLEIATRKDLIHDGGPFYHEFIADALVKEPWNAYSSLFFFVPVIYWIWKLKGEYRENLIIVALLPLLFLNGLGSTLFHAFRAHSALLFLDFMPASLMSITLSTYLWTQITKKWYWGILVVMGFYILGFASIGLLMQYEGMGALAPNVGYFFVGASFFAPVLIILGKTNFYKVKYAALTFVFLGLALSCRASDYPTTNPFPDLLPQGTHFLWHIFTVLAAFSMGFYVYYINKLGLTKKGKQ